MLGGFLALLAAATFALNNAAFRRGALYGTVGQAMALSLPIGLLIFGLAALLTGTLGIVGSFDAATLAMLCVAGVLHFAWGRYCNFRATKAIGANLVGPLQQVSLIITLGLAALVLGEQLTPLRLLGIALVLVGSAVAMGTSAPDAKAAVAQDSVPFRPRYVEGYTFALLSATGYGATPVLVRMSLSEGGLAASLGGGLVAYAAATVVLAFFMLRPRRLRELVAIDRTTLRWFTASAVLVSISQMFAYMALAIAPVSIVMPIQRLSLVLRVFASALLNRQHEVFGGRVYLATAISLAGALALTVSADFLASLHILPDALAKLLR